MSILKLEDLPRLAHQTAEEIADVMFEEYINNLLAPPSRQEVQRRLMSILQLYEPELQGYYQHLEPLVGATQTRELLDHWTDSVVRMAGARILARAQDFNGKNLD